MASQSVCGRDCLAVSTHDPGSSVRRHGLDYAANVAGHAAVGCGSALASGGSCQSGALSGAMGAAVSPLLTAPTDVGTLVRNTAITATAGGLGAVAGGGKFADGAVTGAFGYLFNQAAPIVFQQLTGLDPFGAEGYARAQQGVQLANEKVNAEILDALKNEPLTVTFGLSGEATALTGVQLSGGVFASVNPLNFGLWASRGDMTGLAVGATGSAGLVFGAEETLRGQSWVAGAVYGWGGSATFNSQGQVIGSSGSIPGVGLKGGLSGGWVQTCTWSMRGGAGC